MYHILVFVTYGVRIRAPQYNFITLSTSFDTPRHDHDTICTYSHNTVCHQYYITMNHINIQTM